MTQNQIKITKHTTVEPVNEKGDILHPFQKGGDKTPPAWYSKVPEDFYINKPYYPLIILSQNPWASLDKLRVSHFELKKETEYTCPYNGYIHYWCVPVVIFSDDISFWIKRYKNPKDGMYLNEEWIKNNFRLTTNNKLSFTKIQRALLGPGYTDTTLITDGVGYLYDTLLALNNEDYIGAKVWIWFNKN